jgi:hypothetical protein
MSNTFTKIQAEEKRAGRLVEKAVAHVASLLDEVKEKAGQRKELRLSEARAEAKAKLEGAKKDIGKSHQSLKSTYLTQVKEIDEKAKQKRKEVVELASKKFFQFISS